MTLFQVAGFETSLKFNSILAYLYSFDDCLVFEKFLVTNFLFENCVQRIRN